MKYGYCRISTQKQNIERQVRNILAVCPDAHIVREIYTGTKFQGRKELEKIIKIVKAGDEIYFDSVSRMSRDAEEGYTLYEDLFLRGVSLVFLKEPQIDTETYRQVINNQISVDIASGDKAADDLMRAIVDALNNYVLALARKQIQLAFLQAEKEVHDLRQRTREGMVTARMAGKQVGRQAGSRVVTKKEVEAKNKIRKYCRAYGGPLTNAEVWQLAGITKTTFYRYRREMDSEDSGICAAGG